MNGFFSGKKVLLIGGTGTIGQSLLKNILIDNPMVVRILSRDEYKQFLLQQEYKEYTNIRYLIGDIRDYNRVERAMQDIDYVFHTAAMKHVPACEYNPFEAVQTNILGTQNVIQAALTCDVKKVVFTSTDKAISPTNTYGASKLMAERLISAAQYHSGSKRTIFAAVRFGNVMGSRGSVIPLFEGQIRENRKITITHAEMTRFMMSKAQAAELTIRAMEVAKGGEIFVLKMPVIRIADLVSVIIEEMSVKLSISPSEIQVEEIGIRPGEKLFEELMTKEESISALETSELFIIPNGYVGLHKYHEFIELSSTTKQSYSSHLERSMDRESLKQWIRNLNLLEGSEPVQNGVI